LYVTAVAEQFFPLQDPSIAWPKICIQSVGRDMFLLLVGCFVVGTVFIEKSNEGKPGDYYYQALANCSN
jgi:hypothetical protein